MGEKGRQSRIISARTAMKDKGEQRETKQNHHTPASKKSHGRARETKQNHLSPASKRAMWRQRRQKETKGQIGPGPRIVSMQDLRTPHGKGGYGNNKNREALAISPKYATNGLQMFTVCLSGQGAYLHFSKHVIDGTLQLARMNEVPLW